MRKPVLHGGGGGTAATPRRSTSSKLARIEAAVCANGLTHLVLGVYLLVTASVWWFGAYKEFHFGHGVNGEPIWQRWPISYVFLCMLGVTRRSSGVGATV